MQDWLGNPLNVGDKVVYTSKSRHVGMVLGVLTVVTPEKMTLKPIAYSGSHSISKAITLLRHQDAFKAITRYFGEVPE